LLKSISMHVSLRGSKEKQDLNNWRDCFQACWKSWKHNSSRLSKETSSSQRPKS